MSISRTKGLIQKNYLGLPAASYGWNTNNPMLWECVHTTCGWNVMICWTVRLLSHVMTEGRVDNLVGPMTEFLKWSVTPVPRTGRWTWRLLMRSCITGLLGSRIWILIWGMIHFNVTLLTHCRPWSGTKCVQRNHFLRIECTHVSAKDMWLNLW